MSRIEELRKIRTKVEAGEVDAGTLEQLVYGLTAEVEGRLYNEACQRAELETCNSTIDALTAQLAAKDAEVVRLRAALQEIAVAELQLGLYHGGETYCGMNQRIKRIATSALAATSGGEGE